MGKYSLDIKALKMHTARLKQIKDILAKLEENALEIEKSLCEIDGRLPMDYDDGSEEALAVDLLDEAFNLIDEILGPPKDEYGISDDPDTVSLEEILKTLGSATKNTTS